MMNISDKGVLAEEPLSEAAVAAYLRAHPDFFERHLPLLEMMRVPHPCGEAVSLVERQTGLLRERNRALERKLVDLVQVARENEGLSRRMYQLALGLMQADSLDGVLATTQEQLRNGFRADVVVVRLCGDPRQGLHFTAPDDPAMRGFDALFETRRPRCGRLSEVQYQALFPGHDANGPRSAVAVPLLDGTRPLGVLGMGSHDDTRFHPGMGTLFLDYLSEIISHAILHRLAVEPPLSA
ncbi:hypothetical protein SAMN05421693_11670 [Ectothiorhodospira magna]|uniref:Phytochrome sensor protein n=1 Tax=Ectothiorhodospira magna TaxID=867345 RepID=A0A1H9D887_9GAMM|nr:DUF484 family protein [Ectothiorhodospira magna]SEQ09685.1 hypothetical protein SAMN05421693_11670 [Ectothiorhodospira magna]